MEAGKGQADLTTRVKPAMAMALVNMRNRWVGAVLRSEGTFVRMTGISCLQTSSFEQGSTVGGSP